MFDEQDMRVGERLASLEVRVDRNEVTTKEHDELIADIREKMTMMVVEVRQIRNALYVLAGAVAMNIPALGGILQQVKALF